MARVARSTPRRKVRLRSSKGTRRVDLPRTPRVRRPPRVAPRLALVRSVEESGRRFRRRVRRGIPIVGRKRIDRAVHDLRTAARRLLAVLEAVEPFVGAKRSRKLRRRVEAVLDRSGRLRDASVQMDMLPGVVTTSTQGVLARLAERLRDTHEREAHRLHGRLRARDARRLRREIRRVVERARSAKAVAKRALLEPARARFARLRKSRLAVSPADVRTIHRMRIQLKTFRYLLEVLGPVAAGVGKKELQSLHALQTTMGDLHDVEVLQASLARHVAKKEPDAAAELAPVLESLEVRHSAMLTSFLEAVDPILESWDRVLTPRRKAAGRA